MQKDLGLRQWIREVDMEFVGGEGGDWDSDGMRDVLHIAKLVCMFQSSALFDITSLSEQSKVLDQTERRG